MPSPIFDADSPYASLKAHDINGYLRATVSGHPIADSRGRLRLHRGVLFDAIGEGPHACDYCGIGGLRWDTTTSDLNYLTVDHVNHVKTDCRRENLRAAHKYCNDNRAVVERIGLPWERIAAIPLEERPPLRTRDGEPTEAAYALAAGPATSPVVTAASVTSDESGEVSASTSPLALSPGPAEAPEHRWYTWDDYCDKAELAKGNIVLKGPPEWLKAKHPALRKVDHIWGRK